MVRSGDGSGPEGEQGEEVVPLAATPGLRPGRKEGEMTSHRSILVLVLLVAGIPMAAVPSPAATRGYIVNPSGLLLTLDTDTDTVTGIRQIPIPFRRGEDGALVQRAAFGLPPQASEAPRVVGKSAELMGRSLLTPQGDRMIVLDPMPYGMPHGLLIDEEPTGRLFVYDAATGEKLGHVGLCLRGTDRLAAIHPAGDKAYVVSEGPRADQMTITVVSLTTFSVMKELVVPRGDFFLSEAAG